MDYSSVHCPHCGQPNMAPIIYGFPTPELIDLARQDIIALGGHMPESFEEKSSHYCYQCNEVA